MSDVGERPPWNESAARRLLGKDVLVGLTFERPSGGVIVQVQLHGAVTRVDAHHGIGIKRRGSGELFWLPPDLRAFEEAAPGEYRLRSTGETVIDPDFLTAWTVTAPRDDADPDWRETVRAGFEPPNDD